MKRKIPRRQFIAEGSALALAASVMPPTQSLGQMNKSKAIQIARVNSNFEREPLIEPYAFKGSAITQVWQTMAYLESASGRSAIGLGTQGVLWSDASVFSSHSENGGNALMYAISERALQMIAGTSFSHPVELLDQILPEVFEYAKKVTRNPNLRKTFALNSLVGLDNAAWILYASENGITSFDDLIPEAYKPGLSYRHEKVASVPSYSVGTSPEKIKAAADQGYFVMKLKTGSPGSQSEMLEKDMAFMTAVHKAIGHYETPYTENGKIPYYFDANGRYQKKETLERFLDHARKIGAFEQIGVIEEPFDEFNEAFVGDLGVRVAADESAHTDTDAARRIDQGYSVFAVKAIAKTLSMTMKITQLAFENQIPCFCADLTVNPILVDWNKCVAARLSPIPGIKVGLQETNGHQYYRNWDQMMGYHPRAGAEWTQTKDGVYLTGPSFYQESAGILLPSPHYVEMFKSMNQ